MTQARPVIRPPNMTTRLGPYLSMKYPSIGVSQVWTTTKIVKATWIAARSQLKVF